MAGDEITSQHSAMISKCRDLAQLQRLRENSQCRINTEQDISKQFASRRQTHVVLEGLLASVSQALVCPQPSSSEGWAENAVGQVGQVGHCWKLEIILLGSAWYSGTVRPFRSY